MAPPAAAVLTYRNSGKVTTTDSNGKATETPYPAITTREVKPQATAEEGTFGYTVAEHVGATVTTTTFFVDPTSGLYLSGIVTRLSDGSSDTFTPADPRSLPILPLPAAQGTQIQGVGVDPITQTAVSVTGSVIGKATLHICGAYVDAWRVTISQGRTVSPDKQLVFTRTYDIGTQFGGLVLHEEQDLQCDPQASVRCDSGLKVHARTTAVIDTVPQLTGRETR